MLQMSHRKNIKRSVSFFIIIALAFGTSVFAKGQAAMPERLVALGIIQDDEGGVRAEDTLTRAEFCQMAARMLQVADINTDSMETGFSDLPARRRWKGSLPMT